MKWWFACILMIITASGTFIPCCQDDECNAKEISANHHEEQRNTGMCSPFNACASCAASVELCAPVEYAQPLKQAQVYYERLQAFDPALFTNLCWQPPRAC